MTQVLSLSRYTSNNYDTCMSMPVHIFISLGNILAAQFKQEAEEQRKQQEDSTSNGGSFNIPSNIRSSLSQLSDISNLASSLTNV